MAGNEERKPLSRRAALGMIAAAAPAAAIVGGAAAADQQAEAPPPRPAKPSDYAKFVARHAEGLSGKERNQLRKQLPGLESALKKIRDYHLPDEIEPSFTFRAIRSGKGGRR